MNSAVISANIQRIRNDLGISQAEAAERAEITRTAYRNIELGESIPKVSTLQQIADGFGVPIQELVAHTPTLEAVRFRANKTLTSRGRILADVARWLRDYNCLEDTLNNRIKYLLPDASTKLAGIPAGRVRASKAALWARKQLNLSEDEPINDICGLLEEAGIKVYTVKVASDGFFGLSISKDSGGPAIVVNVWDRISVERWIFSAAHELGHLIMHLDSYNVDDATEIVPQEEEANLFASYFLIPQRAFQNEWKASNGLAFVRRVLKVKRIFRVSYKTVIYRLQEETGKKYNLWGKFQTGYRNWYGRTLGKADEPEALSGDHFAVRLAAHEPENLKEVDFMPERLHNLIRDAVLREEITLSRAAEILRQDLSAMRELAESWEVE